MDPYLNLLITLLFALGLAGGVWLLATVLNPRSAAGGIFLARRTPTSLEKTAPFECGNPSTPFRRRFNVKFYAVALVFVIFDVEVIFLFPWGVLYQELGLFGFLEMLVFLFLLVVALIYVIRKGALVWT